MSRGRKSRLTEEKFLNAVRRTKSVKASKISNYLGMDRTWIHRYITNPKNKDVIDKAETIISELKIEVRFDGRFKSLDQFFKLPVIEEWCETQKQRRVRPSGIRSRAIVLFNVCNHLQTHPDKLTLDMVGKMVVEYRDKQERKEDVPRGLKYLTIRKPLRSFFQLVRGVSGELLTSKGIDAGRSRGTGSHSRERVTKEQRDRFKEELRNVITEIYNHSFKPFTLRDYKVTEEITSAELYFEMLGLDQFMYYTGTRIGVDRALEQGALSIKLNNEKHKLSKAIWYINLKDKGSKGGIEWDKMLIDDGIECLKEYISKRFNIPYDHVETEMIKIDSYMFPVLEHNYNVLRKINKEVLRRCGNNTGNPNHIWRHTFAQDCLHASGWNYELTAEIGGWKDTGTLKLSYGKMSGDAKERGLKEIMGLPVKEIKYVLRW